MKFSRYNLKFEFGGKEYVYNTLSTALVEIDKMIADSIESNDISNLDSMYINELSQLHFVVEDEAKEEMEYMYYFNSMKYRIGSKSLGLIFIPTYSCNLSCPYCLQGMKKDKKIISDEDLARVLSFVEKRLNDSKKDAIPISKINATIYGGEPLMAKQQVISFCNRLQAIAESKGIEQSIQIISNCTLLDDEIMDLMKKHNIGVQVSIDGNKTEHDKTRTKYDGSGTFDMIVEKLKKLNNKGLKKNVVIRINVNENNVESAEEIMSMLREYSDDIYFAFVSRYRGFNDSFDLCLADHGYSEILTKKIYPIYEKFGLPVYRPFGKEAPCSICTENRYVVDANLDVYKCEVLVNRPDTKVGVIDDSGNVVYNSNFYKQMSVSPDRNAKCMECKLLPLCGGGCVGKEYINRTLKNSDFDCYHCKMQERDLMIYLRDFVKRIQRQKD